MRPFSFKLARLFGFGAVVFAQTVALGSAANENHAEQFRLMRTQDCLDGRCAVSPVNSRSGTPSAQEAYHAGRKILDEIAATGTDRDRWGAITLFSTSTRQSSLQIDIVRNPVVTLRLSPPEGLLYIQHPGKTHVYEISQRPGAQNDTCPKYNVNVIDGSATHALIRKMCRAYELKPGHVVRSSTYYLYDSVTATMRSIWAGYSDDQEDEFPDADPRPEVKKTDNGYRFDWVGYYRNDKTRKRQEFHNRYQRKFDKTTGKIELICVDMASPSGENVENEMCEGYALPLVRTLTQH